MHWELENGLPTQAGAHIPLPLSNGKLLVKSSKHGYLPGKSQVLALRAIWPWDYFPRLGHGVGARKEMG